MSLRRWRGGVDRVNDEKNCLIAFSVDSRQCGSCGVSKTEGVGFFGRVSAARRLEAQSCERAVPTAGARASLHVRIELRRLTRDGG